VGRFWWPTSFDATLGFPGEGPPFPWVTPSPSGAWLRRAARVLTGDEAPANQPWIADGLSDEAIHDVLVGIALRGNSAKPIAARCQSRPTRVAGLLGTDDPHRSRPPKAAPTLFSSALINIGVPALFAWRGIKWGLPRRRSIG
jgi:hypothetical protein